MKNTMKKCLTSRGVSLKDVFVVGIRCYSVTLINAKKWSDGSSNKQKNGGRYGKLVSKRISCEQTLKRERAKELFAKYKQLQSEAKTDD